MFCAQGCNKDTQETRKADNRSEVEHARRTILRGKSAVGLTAVGASLRAELAGALLRMLMRIRRQHPVVASPEEPLTQHASKSPRPARPLAHVPASDNSASAGIRIWIKVQPPVVH